MKIDLLGYSIIKTKELVEMEKFIDDVKYDIKHTDQFKNLKAKYNKK